MSYKKEFLGDHIDILSGFAFKTKDFVDKGVPIIKIKNINPPCVTLDDLTYVSTEVAEKQRKFTLSYNDVLIAMTGSHINQWASVVGRVARVKYSDKTLLNQRVGKITIKDNTETDINYIYYFLSQDTVKIELAVKAGGAANQANISPAHIKGLSFPCPNLETQRKIGNILKAYDDLIENNQKQIKLLEEAAQRLYKEWFVDLRFPGYEHVKIVDGVPEGWYKQAIGDTFTTVLGGTPSRANLSYWNGDIPWINSGEINSPRIVNESEFITELGLKKSSTKLMPKHTTVLAITGATLGQVSYTEIETCANQSVVGIIDDNQFYSVYLYLYVSNNIWSMIGKATGGAQQHINKDIVNAYHILLPSKDIIIKLNTIVEPMFSKMANLYVQNMRLAEARDRLLPKLMSGEIEV